MDNMNISKNDEFSEIFLKNGFALKLLETDIDILLQSYAYEKGVNPVEHVKSRLKSYESSIKKLEKKGYEINSHNLLKHVHDIIGIRIVCSFLSDVYDIVNLIKNSKQFKIKEEKDYIKEPKQTGYISYHIIIEVPIYFNDRTEYVDAEIQIRTLAMDFWASLDHKLQYKSLGVVSNDIKNEIYNCSLDIRKLDDKMNELNDRIKNNKNGQDS